MILKSTFRVLVTIRCVWSAAARSSVEWFSELLEDRFIQTQMIDTRHQLAVVFFSWFGLMSLAIDCRKAFLWADMINSRGTNWAFDYGSHWVECSLGWSTRNHQIGIFQAFSMKSHSISLESVYFIPHSSNRFDSIRFARNRKCECQAKNHEIELLLISHEESRSLAIIRSQLVNRTMMPLSLLHNKWYSGSLLMK
jgi:hypothetical protein